MSYLRKLRAGSATLLIALAVSLLAHAVVLVVLAPHLDPTGSMPPTTPFSARIAPVPSPPQADVVPASKRAPRRPADVPVRVQATVLEDIAIISQPPVARMPSATLPPAAEIRLPPVIPEQVALAAPTARADAVRTPPFTLPAHIRIEYDLKSSLVDGHADYVWKRTGDRYEIDGNIEADGFFATMFVGRIEQNSRGDITAQGIQPAQFSLKRGESTAEVARFNWAERKIRQQRTRGEHVQELAGNAQDLLSFIFQFGYEFQAGAPAPGPARIAFAITNARRLDAYEFRVVGNETLQLAIGTVDTVHVIRQTNDPADTYEAWLARDSYFLPVKLRYMLGGRAQVEQTAVLLQTSP